MTTGKGSDKKAAGTPKGGSAINRYGLSAEQYYNKEIEIYEKTRTTCEDTASQLAGAARDEAFQKCQDEFLDSALQAQRRRGMPAKRTVAEKKEESLVDQADFAARLKRQTPQNYLLENLRSFAESDLAPCPQDLENLTLVSQYKGNLVNKITTSTKLGPLMNATPFELSQLTPYFKMCKKEGAEGKLTEFQFMDKLNWKYDIHESAGGGGRERDILSSYGQGVGFKSFKWDTTGTNLFSAPRTLSANISLHFQSVSELAQSARGSQGNGPRWWDLIVPRHDRLAPSRECPTVVPELNALLRSKLTHAELAKFSADERAYKKSGSDFAVVVEVGWTYGVNAEISQALRNAVDASRIVLNLTLVQHKFRFREEGTIDLDIEYVARLEGIMNDYGSNLLNITSDGKSNAVAKEMEDVKSKIQVMQTAIDSPTGVFACVENPAMTNRQQNALDAKAAKLDKRIDKLQEELAALTKQLKLSLYGKFTQFLLKKKRLFFLDVSDQDYAYSNIPLTEADSSVAQEKAKTNAIGQLAEGTVSATQNVSTGNGALGDRDLSDTKIKSRVYGAIKRTKGKREGYNALAYFYLGDLINFYGGVMPAEDTNDVDKFEILLGDLTFLDYKMVGGSVVEELQDDAVTEDIEVSEATTQVAAEGILANQSAFRVTKNLAHVPISFSAYTTWFTDEVINGDEIFTFKSFVQSLTTRLLVGTLQATEANYVHSDLRRLMKERNQVKSAVVYGKNIHLKRRFLNTEKVDPATGESTLLIKPQTLHIKHGNTMSEAVEGGVVDPLQKDRQFFVFSVSRLPFESQVVDEEKNAKEGVYHLKIGADKGLVKTIDLQRESNKRIRDANIMRAYNNGGAGLGSIKEPYNATVRIFGGGFFQPGTYVYINPTTIGLGTGAERLSIARMLGIGGFYLITHVSSMVTDGILETTLKCIYQNDGYLPDAEATEALASGEPATLTDTEGNSCGPVIISSPINGAE